MSTEATARPAFFRPSPLVARALRDLGLFASDTMLATAWAAALVIACSTFSRSRYERAAREALCVALAAGDADAAERAAMLLADDGAAMQAAATEAREAYEAQRAAERLADAAHAAEVARRRGVAPAVVEAVATDAQTDACPACVPYATGPVCAEHLAAIDSLAAEMRPAIGAMVRETIDALTEAPEPRFVECPRCEGHGDVPGEFHRHNPTGLVECPLCHGEREVPNPAYEAATNDNAALAQADAIDGDLTLDQRLPCEHGYEVAS